MTSFLGDFPSAFPGYMQGPYFTSLAGAVGLELDNRSEQCLQMRLAAIPYAGGPNPQRIGAARLADGRLIECPDYVLPVHARNAGVVLYATEPPLCQRIRISQRYQIARMDGTHWGEIANVLPYFVECPAQPRIAIVFQDNRGTPGATWYQIDSSGNRSLLYTSPSNFSYDSFPSFRSRYWVFFDLTGTGYSPPNTYDSGGIYDTSGWIYDQGPPTPFPPQRAADVVAMLLERKSAHSWLAGVAAWWPMTGGAPFPTASGVPTQDASGWWSLPNGSGTWAGYVGADGRGTRPPNLVWLYDNPAPEF